MQYVLIVLFLVLADFVKRYWLVILAVVVLLLCIWRGCK